MYLFYFDDTLSFKQLAPVNKMFSVLYKRYLYSHHFKHNKLALDTLKKSTCT